MSGRVAYIETYYAGSHARIAELLRLHSKHDIQIFSLEPEHWRWRSLTAHYAIAGLIERSTAPPPDALIVSGPVQLASLRAVLPSGWANVPCAVYFHESQWSYPAAPYDPRPYLVGHLDALALADRVWFNSAYHRSTFYAAASQDRSLRVRMLARQVLETHWHKTSVLYPPVEVAERLRRAFLAASSTPRICWAARWEAEKRPDLFVEAIQRLRSRNIPLELAVFLGGSGRSLDRDPLYDGIADLNKLERPAHSRRSFECNLARCDILVSTAEHEFFGVAAVEAAMLGAIPLTPDGLAYPETLPSAPRYQPGDLDGLVDALDSVIGHQWKGPAPWRQDSLRFLPARTIPAYDRAIDQLLAAS